MKLKLFLVLLAVVTIFQYYSYNDDENTPLQLVHQDDEIGAPISSAGKAMELYESKNIFFEESFFHLVLDQRYFDSTFYLLKKYELLIVIKFNSSFYSFI